MGILQDYICYNSAEMYKLACLPMMKSLEPESGEANLCVWLTTFRLTLIVLSTYSLKTW